MNPGWDFHAIAPEIIISATIIVVLIADFFFEYRQRFRTPQLATIGVLAAMASKFEPRPEMRMPSCFFI